MTSALFELLQALTVAWLVVTVIRLSRDVAALKRHAGIKGSIKISRQVAGGLIDIDLHR